MTSPVRIPADVDMADRVLGPLTARQLAILAVTALLLYTVWTATRMVVPVAVFLAVAVPVGSSAAVLALGQRDGMSLDRLLLAAVRQRMRPRQQVPAAEDGIRPAPDWLTARTTPDDRDGSTGRPAGVPGVLRLPARAVTDTGVIDLDGDGLAVVAVASTVNFALRTPAEQEALVAGFGRYLHSLTGPAQVLIRAERLDLTAQVSELRENASGLPHPALEGAALEHAEFLMQLGEQTDLLHRQVLLVLREPLGVTASPDGLGGPSPWAVLATLARGLRRGRRDRIGDDDDGDGAGAAARRAAQARLARRLREAIELLVPAGVVLSPLDAGQATAVLAAACNPDSLLPPSTRLAGADEVITTTAPRPDPSEAVEPWPHHSGGSGQVGGDPVEDSDPGLEDEGELFGAGPRP